MQLSGTDLACIRGGREVFTGLGFALRSGEALLVAGRNGAVARDTQVARMALGTMVAVGAMALAARRRRR